jgi:hypothetical protein
MQMNYTLKQNLDALAMADPELVGKIHGTDVRPNARIAPAKTGRPYLEVDGVSLCSRFDPDAEAETLAERVWSLTGDRGINKVAVFGLGLGYHVAALARRFEKVFVIEPQIEMIRLALEHLDFRDVISRITFLFDPDEITPDDQTVLLVHPPSLRLSPADAEPWLGKWPDWNQSRQKETFGVLIDKLNTVAGINRMGNRLDLSAPAEIEPMVQLARCGQGALTQAEQMVLLLDELARA